MSNFDQFSPVNLVTLIRVPLRHFFSMYPNSPFAFDEDPIKTKIIIENFDDYHQETEQKKPRVLVRRGNYQIQKTGLTDNLYEGLPMNQTLGSKDDTNAVFIQGEAQVVIESRQKGVCEILTDMVSHFIVWSRPLLCNEYGFKEFGLNMDISEASPGKEDTEIFSVTVSIPWIKEELWKVKSDDLQLNSLNLTIQKALN